MKQLIIILSVVVSSMLGISAGYAQGTIPAECVNCCTQVSGSSPGSPCWVACTGKPYQVRIPAGAAGCISPAQPGVTATLVSSAGGFCIYQLIFTASGTYNIGGTCFKVLQKPQAIISNGNPIYLCKGATAYFINGSIGGVAYSWDFGDPSSGASNTSNSAGNPVPHLYANAGTYTVTLVAIAGINQNGQLTPCCTDTTHITVIVDNNPGPVVGCLSPVCDSSTGNYCITSNPSGCAYTWSTNTGNTVVSSGNCATFNWNTVPLGSIILTPSGSGCCPYASTFYIPIMPKGPFTISGSNTVCAGSIGVYSAPVIWGANYSWSISPSVPFTIPNPANPSQIAVNWPPSGTFTITCNMSNDVLECTGTGTITVNVKPKFQVNGPANACANQSVTFTSTASSGTTTWSVTPSASCTTSGSNYNCSFSTPGPYTITATNSNYCNSPSATVVIHPLPLAPALSGPLQVMPGCTYTYTATSAGPVTWTVTPNTATVVNAGNSIQVTWPSGFTTGNVIAVAMQDSCFSPADTLHIDTVSRPAITGGGSLCSNGQNSFSVSSLPANTTIQWTISPATAGSVTAGQGTQNATVTWYTVTTSTPVTVTATITNGCTNTSFAVLNATGTLLPEPVAAVSGNLLFCSGSSTTITATGGTSYLWDGSFTGPSHSFNTAGQHNVEVTNTFGCKKKIYFTLVEVPSPVITLSTTTAVQCVGSVLQPFTLATIVGSGYTVTNYTFKDPGGVTLCSGTTPSCSVSSPTPGTYTVTVSFSYTYNGNPVSCTKTASLTIGCPSGTGSGSGCSQNPANCHYSITYSYQNCNSIQVTINPFPQCGTFSPPDSINLDWGDGNTTNIYSFYDTNTHTYVLTHTYSLPAYYHLFLDCNLGSIDIPVGAVVNFSLVHDTCSINLLDFSSAITGATFTFTSVNWGDGNTNTSTTHVYANSGTDTVTLTYNLNGNPCTASQIITVVKPTFTISASPNPACAGAPVSFSVGYTAPFTSANVASFDWDFGDTSAHSHDSVTQHSYTNAGTHTVTLTIKDIYGCIATKTLTLTTIAPIAYTLTTNSPQCDSVTLAIHTPSGSGNPTLVTWLPATVDSLGGFQYSAFISGSYIATVTDPNGCKVTLSGNITVYPKPALSIITSDSLCTGQTYPITNNGSSSQFSFSWQISGISTVYSQSDTGTNITFTPATAGTYQIVLVATLKSSPFCSASIKDTVTVFGSPAVTVTPSVATLVCAGTPVTMTGSVTGNSPFTYSWNTGQTTSNITVYINGSYTLTVTDVNGCKGKASATANISPLPDFSVFAHGCDTLCFDGQDSIHGPAGYTNYQFLIDNVTVQNGNSSVLVKPCSQTAMQDGAPHIIKLIITTAFSCIDSAQFQLKCKNCNICACDTSVHFNSPPYVSYSVDGKKKSDSSKCNSDKFLQLPCNNKYDFAISLVYPSGYDSCHVKDSAVLINSSGTVVASQASVTPSNPLSFGFTVTGHYCITHYLKVNGKICDSCKSCVDVNCSKCQCNPEIHFSSNPYVSYAADGAKHTDSTTCGSVNALKLECKRSYQFAIAFTAPAGYDTCKITDSAVITDGLGNIVTSSNGVTPSHPLSYTFTQSGAYCITFYLQVNGKICDSCRFCTTVSCPIPPSCSNCAKILNSSYFELNDTVTNSNGYQLQNGTVNFSILANAQQVKISIADIEYSWSDGKCQDCHTHTIGRGCLYAANSTQTIGGLILDANAAQFLPLGSKPDECPEEVIWTMGNYANAGTYSVPIQFSLPQGLIPTCCSLKVTKLCIRLSIRDINCLVCDTVICFTVRPACCKGSKWQGETLSWQGTASGDPSLVGTTTEKVTNTLSVVCGQTYTIADGVSYTFNASYMCNPADNCKPKMKVGIKQPGGTTTLNNMPYSKSFSTPGTYTITYYAYCGNTICDSCVFKLFLPKDCCKGSKWLDKKVTFKKANGSTQTKNLNDGDVISGAGTTTVAVSYQCGQDCSPTYSWKRWRKSSLLDSATVGTTTTGMSVNFTPPSSGCDSIVITAYCDGKPCATLSFWHCCISCSISTGSLYTPPNGYMQSKETGTEQPALVSSELQWFSLLKDCFGIELTKSTIMN